MSEKTNTIVMSPQRAWVIRSDGPEGIEFYQSTSVWVDDVAHATIFPNEESAKEMAEEYSDDESPYTYEAVTFYSVVTRGPLARVN